MPVVIKELHIKAVAAPVQQASDCPPEENGANHVNEPAEDLIEACVKEVLKILERKNQR